MLHKIAREITRPKLSEDTEKGLAAFQKEYENRYPLIIEVGKFNITISYVRRGLEIILDPHSISVWFHDYYREGQELDWSLVTVRYENTA